MSRDGRLGSVREVAMATSGAGVIAPSGAPYEIAGHGQRAVVVEVGDGLRTYAANGRVLLDGYGLGEMCSAGRGQVLIPWPNRVRDGCRTFAGRRQQLALSEPSRMNAIHGLVRWASRTLAELGADRVVMEHHLRPQPGYRFSLALRIEYLLSPEGLRVTTTARNDGPDACPFGSGAHPYLTVGTATVDDAILRVPARTVLQADERGIPIGEAPVEGTEHDFRLKRPIGPMRLDHGPTDLERDEDDRARIVLRRRDDAASVVAVGRRHLSISHAVCRRHGPEHHATQHRHRTDDPPSERISRRNGGGHARARRATAQRAGHQPRREAGEINRHTDRCGAPARGRRERRAGRCRTMLVPKNVIAPRRTRLS